MLKQLGKPYQFGAKWPSTDTDPQSPVDCSGFSRWAIAQGRDGHGRQTLLPHGCINQIKVCTPLGIQKPCRLDLGFADLHGNDGAPDHVIIKLDDVWVIEARGPQQGADYNKIIKRPISVWEAQKGFLGWWRPAGIYS
jgi:cell wall-associated NlpC family hydrolase